MATPAVTLRHWKRAEYDRLVELGVFEGEHIELLGGQLIVAEPQGSYHASQIGVVGDVIRAALPPGWSVRIQSPIALDDDSEPEPDVAVVAGTHKDYAEEHPSRPALLIEVAQSRLSFDQTYKASLYSRGGVADYWVVNLVDHVVEIHRDPVADANAAYGWRYRSVQIFRRSDIVTPLAFPAVRIRVAELLP
jgi:Uma2 family endonuclease